MHSINNKNSKNQQDIFSILSNNNDSVFAKPLTLFTKSFIIGVHRVLDIPASIYLLKVNNRNFRIWFEISSKLTIKAAIDVVLVSLLLTLNIFLTFF